MPPPISLPPVTVRLPRDFHIGGQPLGGAPSTTSTTSTTSDPAAQLPAPRAFNNPLELISWLHGQSVRDILVAIGIGGKRTDAAEAALDGKLIGGNNSSQGGINWRDVDGVKPRVGLGGAIVAGARKLLEINGINTPIDVQRSNVQFLADKSGREVVGVHNSSGGLLEDAVQFLNDKYIRCENPAVNTVRDAVLDSVKKGEPIDLVCHSQGAIITERALCEAQCELKQELKPATYERFLGADWEKISKKVFPSVREARLLRTAEGQLNAQVENMLSSVRVESFGGAARMWPDGPKYVHHVNMCDPVPGMFGMTFLVPPTHPGKGAIIHRITENHPTDKKGADGVDASVHGPEQVYFKHTATYEEALAHATKGDSAWKRIDS